MPSPILGFDLLYDGMQNMVTAINSALLALEAASQHPPAARAYHNANQSIANTTVTALAFNSERYDTDTIHDTSTNNSRLTCKTAGKYEIFGSVEWATNAVGFRQILIRLNGATYIDARTVNPLSADTTKQGISTVYDLALNDYVELVVYHNVGAPINVNSAGNFSPEFGMVKVG